MKNYPVTITQENHVEFSHVTSLVMSVAGQKNFPSKSATVFVASRYYSTIYFGLEVFSLLHTITTHNKSKRVKFLTNTKYTAELILSYMLLQTETLQWCAL